MKEIVEKYKNEELTLYEFLHNGYEFVAGDQWITASGERVIAKSRVLRVLNKPQSTDVHAYVYKSFQLDKEIAAMEQPKQYKYEKVTESIFSLGKDFLLGNLFTKKFNQEWHQIKTEEQLGGLLSMNDDPTKNGIYRRIELTQEELEAQKVDELAELLRKEMLKCTCRKDEALAAAKKALEWMKQEG